MIVAQERDVKFEYNGLSEGWRPETWWPSKGHESSGVAWRDLEIALGFTQVVTGGYAHTLTEEGVAFRQRFVAFMEAADGS